MNNYSLFKNRAPEIVLNSDGRLIYDNKSQIKLKFEIDYNLFTGEELYKIIGNKAIDNNIKKMLTEAYVPVLNNGKKEYVVALTENTILNFKLIQYNIEIIKDGVKILITEKSYSKEFVATLADGNYIFNINIYSSNGQKVKKNTLEIKLKTNYYSMSSNRTGSNMIVFNKQEGDFSLEISPRSNKYYTFTLDNINSNNNDIFYFNYWNKNNTSKMQRGEVGSEFAILNDNQIKEYEENPELVDEIEGDFVFNIKKVLTGELKETTLGAIRFPTILEKLEDNNKKYCNLKCDVSQNYQSSQLLTEATLITDKFKQEPLFYKFLLDEEYSSLKIKNSNSEIIEKYSIEKISDDISIVYFSPIRNEVYYYSLDNAPYQIVNYKKSWEPFISKTATTDNVVNLNCYIDNLIIMCEREIELDIEVTLANYTKITLNRFKTIPHGADLKFLPDNKYKISNQVISLKIIDIKEELTIVNMISNSKKLKNKILYYKKTPGEFVYYAEEVDDIKLENIPDKELNKLKIMERYNFKNNNLIKCVDGPLQLQNIRLSDIIFTDIDELYEERDIFKFEKIKVSDPEDKFYKENFKRAGAILC